MSRLYASIQAGTSAVASCRRAGALTSQLLRSQASTGHGSGVRSLSPPGPQPQQRWRRHRAAVAMAAASQSGDFIATILTAEPSRVALSGEPAARAGASPVEAERAPADGPVFLRNLLCEYRGSLFVPEEALQGDSAAERAFQARLQGLPLLEPAQFVALAEAGQVERVVSRERGGGGGGGGVRDAEVFLRDSPGLRGVHCLHWRMVLSSAAEARDVLGSFKGRKEEATRTLEARLRAMVSAPARAPHPVAAAVSARVAAELALLSSLTLLAAGGALRAALGMLGLVLSPLWALLSAAAGVLGARLPQLVRAPLTLVEMAAGARVETLLAVVGVLAFMVAMARFTLTRRARDFRKWDIWQAIEFGQSKASARVDVRGDGRGGAPAVGFADVAGIDEVVGELRELVRYLQAPERYARMGTRPPHGVLLEGPPGCGKTLLARAIAGEAGVPFYQMAGSEFVEILVGVGAARVRDLFKRAAVNRPAVVFIDEIDALGGARDRLSGRGGDGDSAGVTERETALNQLLIELDGFDTGAGVIFLGATNRVDMLDAALLRPGRFDRRVTIRPPLAQGRADVLRVHLRRQALAPGVDLDALARNLPGFTGAMLAQLAQEAVLGALRRGGRGPVDKEDLDAAVDRLTLGPRRAGEEVGAAARGRHAAAEAGLALAAELLRRGGAALEPVDRVDVRPRGGSAARTVFLRLPDEDYLWERAPLLRARLQLLLAPRVAEEMLHAGDASEISGRHLADAMWLARKMVTVWNLGDALTVRGERAPVGGGSQFWGAVTAFEGALRDDYGLWGSPLGMAAVEAGEGAAAALLASAHAEVTELLEGHRAALEALTEKLLAEGELSGADVAQIVSGCLPEGDVRWPLPLGAGAAGDARLPEGALAGAAAPVERHGQGQGSEWLGDTDNGRIPL